MPMSAAELKRNPFLNGDSGNSYKDNLLCQWKLCKVALAATYLAIKS